ncbi:MAG: hypothetical protein KBT48_04905 [Firmicutes bacterium]|nr:hypothetical protein [Bacillota bacterium]
MKKKHVNRVMAGIMATALLSPIVPANVQAEEYAPVGYMSSGQFLDTFALVISYVSDEYGQVVPYASFLTQATYDNYEHILWGKQVFDTLPYEVQAEIEWVLTVSTGVSYNALAAQAFGIQAQIAAQMEAERLQAEAQAAQEAQAQQEFVGPVFEEQPIAPAEEVVPEQPVEEVKPEEVGPAQETPVEQEQPVAEQQPAVEENQPNKEEIVVENTPVVEEALFHVNPLEEAPATTEAAPLVMNIAEPAVVKAQEEADPVQEDSEQIQEENEPAVANEEAQMTPPVALNAQDFINNFCSVNGSLIAVVNVDNCSVIINGYDSWTALSTEQKIEVNRILAKAGIRSYTTMYNVAQIVSGTKNLSTKNVQTSVETNASLYSLLCMGAAAMFIFLFKRKSRKSHE